MESDTRAALEQTERVSIPSSYPQSRSASSPTPLPWSSLAVVIGVVVSEGFTSSFILPFVSYMVSSFGHPPDIVGYYSGYVIAAFFLAQLFSNFFIGYLSDKKGRRVAILLGLVGNAGSCVAFGFSKSLWYAILWRFIAGLLNGNNGVIKSYIREITDQSNQARVYSIRSSGYAIGTIMGPFIGGELARPAARWPSLFSPIGVFATFPYLLPCIVAGLINAISIVVAAAFLSEPNRVTLEPVAVELVEKGELHDSQMLNETNHDQYPTPTVLDEVKRTLRDFVGLLQDRDVVVTSSLYGILAFITLAFDGIFSLWSLRSLTRGGLDFEEADVGIIYAVAGVGMLILQLFIYHRVDKAFGSWKTLNLSACILGPVVAAMPFTHFIAASKGADWLWLSICVLMMLKYASSTMGMASVNLMINNAALPENVGSVNGFSASVAAFCRLLAPPVSGTLFALTANSSASFPFDYHFMFLVLGIICVGMYLLSRLALSPSINKRKGKG